MELFGIDLELLLGWATALSLVTLAVTLLAVPAVIARLPADYFVNPQRDPWRGSADNRLLSALLIPLKNLLGGCLVLVGVVLLFTPGQGLLTLLAGFLLMNFPGKYRLERWLVARTGVIKPLNWLRRRGGHPPFEAPADAGHSG